MDRNFDVIVVGAGYVGCSAAYHLTRAGVKTALVDRGGFADAASRANFGNVQIMDMELERSVDMITRAARRFDTLEKELDWKIGLRTGGGLLLIEDEEKWKQLCRRAEILRELGVQAEMVPVERLQEIEPFLKTDGLIGGFYHPFEGQVDPFQFLWGHLVRARQHGLREFYHHEVTGFVVNSERVEGVRSPAGDIHGGMVVLCTGAWTNRLGKTLGRDWDITYILGQALVTEKIQPAVRSCYIAVANFFQRAGTRDEKDAVVANFTIGQPAAGNLTIGEAMYRADHFSRHVPHASITGISEKASQFFPAFRKLRVLRCWSTPVANTSDERPLLGPVGGLDGLILAAGFHSTVIIAPLAGETILQLVTRGKSDLDIAGFSPDRNKGDGRLPIPSGQ